jgi:Retrotransposon gag protein
MSNIVTRSTTRSQSDTTIRDTPTRDGRAVSSMLGRGAAPRRTPSRSSPRGEGRYWAPIRGGRYPEPTRGGRFSERNPAPDNTIPEGAPDAGGDDPDDPGDDDPHVPDDDERDEDDEDPPPEPPNNPLTVNDLLLALRAIAHDRATAEPAAPTPRRVKVNPPEEFDGRSAKKLKSFLVSCNNAFRADPETFRDHERRVSYGLSYLRGSAQRHFDTQLEDEGEPGYAAPDWLSDWPLFVAELRDMFGDPNAEATAEAELDSLRMRTNQKFSDFLVEFNTLASQVNWGDRALRHRLKQALPDRIKDSLALVEEPAGYGDWKRLVLSIDQRYWERQNDIRRDTRSSANRTSTTPRNPPTTGTPAPTPTPAVRAPSTPPRTTTAQGGLTQAERERRISQGLCLYCGGEGHKANECSKARKARERSGRSATIVAGPADSAASDSISVLPEN